MLENEKLERTPFWRVEKEQGVWETFGAVEVREVKCKYNVT